MNFTPLFSAPYAVQLHVVAVVPAAIIGSLILFRRKGTRLHKLFGRIWIILMVITSVSSFFIHQINLILGFSPIHILSVLVLIGCWRAVIAARAGKIAVHRRIMRGVYFGGIVGVGLFAFMPGRLMNEVLFAEGWSSGVLVSGIVALFVCAVIARKSSVLGG
ncbi:DUF2306 domain-containing protein [Ochrobactrum sp. CM-21-5]|nr:DUF2306 domain-containing protein [Ochrobactrum sp. CM-21-5]MBC2885993.1 DUF2306 domain-containing protein [Ochrobactrum sp. CM-21-5]